jgi:hypothetical protein
MIQTQLSWISAFGKIISLEHNAGNISKALKTFGSLYGKRRSY